MEALNAQFVEVDLTMILNPCEYQTEKVVTLPVIRAKLAFVAFIQ